MQRIRMYFDPCNAVQNKNVFPKGRRTEHRKALPDFYNLPDNSPLKRRNHSNFSVQTNPTLDKINAI